MKAKANISTPLLKPTLADMFVRIDGRRDPPSGQGGALALLDRHYRQRAPEGRHGYPRALVGHRARCVVLEDAHVRAMYGIEDSCGKRNGGGRLAQILRPTIAAGERRSSGGSGFPFTARC